MREKRKMAESRRIYVASSWRNERQPSVVAELRQHGHDVYDFRHPAPGNDGFSWRECMPSWKPNGRNDGTVPTGEYLTGIEHPISRDGFALDFSAMKWADTCVLVLPCGRSAHLELGWFVGQGRRTAVLLDGPEVVPELMYRMVDLLATTTRQVVEWLTPCPGCATDGSGLLARHHSICVFNPLQTDDAVLL